MRGSYVLKASCCEWKVHQTLNASSQPSYPLRIHQFLCLYINAASSVQVDALSSTHIALAERLVLAFVLLSVKSDNFLHWSCFASLALLIVASVALGSYILVQWAILIIAMSSLSPNFSLDPLMHLHKPSEDTSSLDQGESDEDLSDGEDFSAYNPTFEVNLLPPASATAWNFNFPFKSSRRAKRGAR
jgi:hypothetical protein